MLTTPLIPAPGAQAATVVPTGGFQGHRLHCPDGTNVFQLRCAVTTPELYGFREQNYSIEMLHWDDYRAAFNIDPTVPTMSNTVGMPTPFQGTIVYHTKSTGGDCERFVMNCTAISEGQYGAATQNLNQDMLHWDDFRATNNINDGTESMKKQFSSFCGHIVESNTSKGEPFHMILKCVTATAAMHGAAAQNYSVEMQHWDDFCVANKVPEATTMAKLCGFA